MGARGHTLATNGLFPARGFQQGVCTAAPPLCVCTQSNRIQPSAQIKPVTSYLLLHTVLAGLQPRQLTATADQPARAATRDKNKTKNKTDTTVRFGFFYRGPRSCKSEPGFAGCGGGQKVRRTHRICEVRTGSRAVPAPGAGLSPVDLHTVRFNFKPQLREGRCPRRSPRLLWSTSRSDAGTFSCHTLQRGRMVGKNASKQACPSSLFILCESTAATAAAVHRYVQVTLSAQTS